MHSELENIKATRDLGKIRVEEELEESKAKLGKIENDLMEERNVMGCLRAKLVGSKENCGRQRRSLLQHRSPSLKGIPRERVKVTPGRSKDQLG